MLGQGEGGGKAIVRALRRERAFDEVEGADGKGIGTEGAVLLQKRLNLAAGVAFEPCQCDMRTERTIIRRETERHERPFDLLLKRHQRGLVVDANPQHPR